MKKGLIFSLEALFIAIIMMSLLFAQIKPLKKPDNKQNNTNEHRTKHTNI